MMFGLTFPAWSIIRRQVCKLAVRSVLTPNCTAATRTRDSIANSHLSCHLEPIWIPYCHLTGGLGREVTFPFLKAIRSCWLGQDGALPLRFLNDLRAAHYCPNMVADCRIYLPSICFSRMFRRDSYTNSVKKNRVSCVELDTGFPAKSGIRAGLER